MRKTILFLTGTRADFGKLKPLMEAVERSDDFECHIFATGMHTLARYGSTYDEIRKADFKNIYLYINQMASSSSAMDMVLASTIQGLGHYIREFPPDMIVVHGDRVEALAGAIVGALNNLLSAHIEGGELSGTVDELIRHSVSKLAHLHFVAHEDARKRLIQMGEVGDSIFVIGSPDVDVMLSEDLPTLAHTKERYGVKFDEYAIFTYHPVTTELHLLRRHATEVVDALLASDANYLVIHPNNDTGSEMVFEALERVKGDPRFRFFPSVRFPHFLTLLKHAKAIVGNSSAGIREAPVYGVPTINIGTRQLNRFHYPSIIDVPEDRIAILNALRNLPTRVTPALHFGQGNSAKLFMEQLQNPDLWKTPRQKQFQDLLT
jgi:UDP-N-acetylglucosamine 2-epimerase (hydrolysing)